MAERTSGLTFDEVRYRLEDSLLPMLVNDARILIDVRCKVHGRPGTGPNFSLVLYAMTVCEVMGRLFAPRVLHGRDRIRWLLGEMARLSGDERYRTLAGPLVVFFRHGIVHTFYPKRHQGVTGVVVWPSEGGFSPCIEHLMSPAGHVQLCSLREKTHLVLKQEEDGTAFQVCPQVLYADLLAAVTWYQQAVTEPEHPALQPLRENHEEWVADNEIIAANQLTVDEWIALGLQPPDRR